MLRTFSVFVMKQFKYEINIDNNEYYQFHILL